MSNERLTFTISPSGLLEILSYMQIAELEGSTMYPDVKYYYEQMGELFDQSEYGKKHRKEMQEMHERMEEIRNAKKIIPIERLRAKHA